MAEFDPKAYLAKKQESAFDPAAYVARKQAADPSVMEHRAPPAAETAHNVDQLDAAAMGLGHGASLGLDDEVSGVARGALHVGKEAAASALGDNTVGRSLLRSYLKSKGLDVPDVGVDAIVQGAKADTEQALGLKPNLVESYRQGRDDSRNVHAESKAAFPTTYKASEVVGGALAPIPGPGKLKPLQTVASRALQYGKYGAGVGGVAGLGASNADLTKGEFGQAAADTAAGAAIGGVSSAVIGPAAELVHARVVRPWANDAANEAAANVVANGAGMKKILRNRNQKLTDENMAQVGQDARDLGLIRPFGTSAGALERLDALIDDTGASIGTHVAQVDALGAQGGGFATQEARLAVRRALSQSADTPAKQAELTRVRDFLLERIGEPVDHPGGMPQNASFATNWQNKSQLQSALKPDELSGLGQQLYRKGVAGYTKNIYDQAERQAGPDIADGLRSAASTYGKAASLRDSLSNQAALKTNTATSIKDLGVGELAGGGLTGAALTAGSRLMRGRMPSTKAALYGAMAGPTTGISGAIGAATKANTSVAPDEEKAIRAFLTGG